MCHESKWSNDSIILISVLVILGWLKYLQITIELVVWRTSNSKTDRIKKLDDEYKYALPIYKGVMKRSGPDSENYNLCFQKCFIFQHNHLYY